MGDLWLPDFEVQQIPEKPGGTYDRLTGKKVLLHTTEGHSIESAVAAYSAYPPHVVVDYLTRRRVQHIPLNLCSYALKRGESDDEAVIQVEIVGFADQAPNWPTDMLNWLAAEVLAPIHRLWPFELQAPPQGFKGPNDGIVPYLATAESPIRFDIYTFAEWSGVCGHQHAPAPDCVTPDTPILCADLTWRAAGDLSVGDEIIAVEEEASERWGRKMLTAVVERNESGIKACSELITGHGKVVATDDHPWLVRDQAIHRGSRYRWVATSDLDAERHQICRYAPVWPTDHSRDGGWLAGLLDADGSLMVNDRPGHGFATLAFSQKVGDLEEAFSAAMAERGFDLHRAVHSPRGDFMNSDGKIYTPNGSVADLRVAGGRFEVMRALGSLRPHRLLRHPRLRQLWDGRYLHKTTQSQEGRGVTPVHSVTPLGLREVASLSTSSRTYIANGLVCHNTHWDPGKVDIDTVLDLLKAGLAPPPELPRKTPDPLEARVLKLEAVVHIMASTMHLADSPYDLVASLYRLILEREPDDAGLLYWTDQLAAARATPLVIIDAFLDVRAQQATDMPAGG